METGTRQLTATDLATLSTTKQDQYGALGATADGRLFRYVGFGGTSTIAPGKLCVAAAVTAAYQGLAITAVGTGTQTAANLLTGSTQIVLTNGATAITQDQFAEGYLEVLQTSGTNNGPRVYRIRGNTAAAASATFTVFLMPSEALTNVTTLVAGTDTANVNPSIFSAVAPSATLNAATGVTLIQIPNSATVTNYGWVQSTGYTLLTNDSGGTLAVGTGVAQSTATAGSIVAAGTTSADIGQTHVAITASSTGSVRLYID